MKILIMGFAKIKYMPYMNFYLENIDSYKNEVHILYWNRDLQDEPVDKYTSYILHEFRCYQEDDVSKISKIKNFAKYRNYAKSIIKQEKFDFIYILHSLPGVLVADILKSRYVGKYIFDYRDSTYEGFAPFKRIVGQLVENSAATFVSSDGFRKLLPAQCSNKIYTSHNLLLDSLSHREEKEKNGIASEKIRIAFWGIIRNEEINKVIIDRASADQRFELHYYGREQQIALRLKAYAKSIGAENVLFHGEYAPEDRYIFVRNTDIIHNIYNDNNMMIAMANKYYDGIIFKLPQLCMTGSFMAHLAETNEIGLSCNPYNTNFTEEVYRYYKNMDSTQFFESCDIELERVLDEYRSGRKIIRK